MVIYVTALTIYYNIPVCGCVQSNSLVVHNAHERLCSAQQNSRNLIFAQETTHSRPQLKKQKVEKRLKRKKEKRYEKPHTTTQDERKKFKEKRKKFSERNFRNEIIQGRKPE